MPDEGYVACLRRPPPPAQAGSVDRRESWIVDRDAFEPVRTGIEILVAAPTLYPDQFSFGERAAHFDRLAGNSWVRAVIERGAPADEIAARWQQALTEFKKLRARYLIYPDH